MFGDLSIEPPILLRIVEAVIELRRKINECVHVIARHPSAAEMNMLV